MKCNFKCPPNLKYFCCGNCNNKSQSLALKDEYPALWDEFGFNGPNGCRLMEARPQECKDYNCHDYMTQIILAYKGTEEDGQWTIIGLKQEKRKK